MHMRSRTTDNTLSFNDRVLLQLMGFDSCHVLYFFQAHEFPLFTAPANRIREDTRGVVDLKAIP